MTSFKSPLSLDVRVSSYRGFVAMFTFFCTIRHVPSTAQPTDPTINRGAVTIDRVWQQASSKYDSKRAALLSEADYVNKRGRYQADWESLQKYQIPKWYKDAKFGIQIHWGVYSVPGVGSGWYGREIYEKGTEEYQHHLATYGAPDKFGYKDLIPMFKADHFDPRGWARLFKEAGARYVVQVVEHHDGFAMYDSELSDWTAVKMGPHRDVVGDLAKAIRAEELHFGAFYLRAEHDWFFDVGRNIHSDVNDQKYAAFYGPAHKNLHMDDLTSVWNDFTYVSPEWADDWLARGVEIVRKYHPDILFLDWWAGQAAYRNNLARLAAFFYNSSHGHIPDHSPVMIYKLYAMQEHTGVLDIEQGQLGELRQITWQTNTSISKKSWIYVTEDTFKSPQVVIHQLADVVSKNGNLQLNIAPKSDGTIPNEVQDILREIGGWLRINSEAIYNTRPWKVYGEGPTQVATGSFHDDQTGTYTADDFRFTTQGDTLYCIEMDWPANSQAVVHSLGTKPLNGQKIKSVELLGLSKELNFEQLTDSLRIQLPTSPLGRHAYVFRITFAR